MLISRKCTLRKQIALPSEQRWASFNRRNEVVSEQYVSMHQRTVEAGEMTISRALNGGRVDMYVLCIL